MLCASRFELFIKSSLGYWTPINVLRVKLLFISSMFVLYRFFRSQSYNLSSSIQSSVYNDSLSHNNCGINSSYDIIFCTCDSIFYSGILVSSLKWALQQPILLSNIDDCEQLWDLWACNIDDLILSCFCGCDNDRGSSLIYKSRQRMWGSLKGISWDWFGVEKCSFHANCSLLDRIIQLNSIKSLMMHHWNDFFILFLLFSLPSQLN